MAYKFKEINSQVISQFYTRMTTKFRVNYKNCYQNE